MDPVQDPKTNLPPTIMPTTEEAVPPPPPTPIIEPPATTPTPVPTNDNAQVIKPKKKWGTGALIGAIGAVLTLVVGLGVGVALIKNKATQDIEKKAAGTCVLTGSGTDIGCFCPNSGWKGHCLNIDDPSTIPPEGSQARNEQIEACRTSCSARDDSAGGAVGEYSCPSGQWQCKTPEGVTVCADSATQTLFNNVWGAENGRGQWESQCSGGSGTGGTGGNDTGGSTGTCQNTTDGTVYTRAKCLNGVCSDINQSQVCDVSQVGQKKCGGSGWGIINAEYTCQKYTGTPGCDLYWWKGTGSCLVGGAYDDLRFSESNDPLSIPSKCKGYLYACPNLTNLPKGCRPTVEPNISGPGVRSEIVTGGSVSLPTISCGTVQIDVSCPGDTSPTTTARDACFSEGKGSLCYKCDQDGDGKCRQFTTRVYTSGCTTAPGAVTSTPLQCGMSCAGNTTNNNGCASDLRCTTTATPICWGDRCNTDGGPTPTPTGTTPSSACQRLEAVRGTEVIASANWATTLRPGDVVVFRGFASAVNTSVTAINFSITVDGGTPQNIAGTNFQQVGSTWQAETGPITIVAGSYSVVATPIYP